LLHPAGSGLAGCGCELTHGLGDGIVRDCINQSDFEGSRGGNLFCGDKKLQRSALPDQARQALRASPSGHEAESGAAMSEDGVGRGDPAVTGEREIKTSAHAVAFDGSDDGDGIARECVHESLPHGGEAIGFGTSQCSDFVKIGADREKLAIARHNKWAAMLPCFVFQIVFQFGDGDGQCEHAGAGEAVGAVGRSETEDACRTVGVDSEEER
jgi:hypothetical protein